MLFPFFLTGAGICVLSICGQLDAVLRDKYNTATVRAEVPILRNAHELCSLVRIFRQYSQPNHIHHHKQTLPKSLQVS